MAIFVRQTKNEKEMGRVKDLFIELQNEYGYELEYLPEGFDTEKYMKEKAQEQEEELFCQKIKNCI